ncbi:hypothetical protein D3C81_2266050 [compost metagenome]
MAVDAGLPLPGRGDQPLILVVADGARSDVKLLRQLRDAVGDLLAGEGAGFHGALLWMFNPRTNIEMSQVIALPEK